MSTELSTTHSWESAAVCSLIRERLAPVEIWLGRVGTNGWVQVCEERLSDELTTSLNYAREPNGRLNLDSEPGVGTTVTVTLPRTRRAEWGGVSPSSDLPRTAFILETNEEVRSMLTAALEEQQWDVTLCANAQEFALSLAIQPPGVAFLDALMPGKINFIRAFEALALASPGSRIVVTTGEATDYQLDEYVHAAAARLVKPLSPERVRSFVKDQLSSTVLPA